MDKINFTYCDGSPLKVDDMVFVNHDKFARVEQILYPGTQAAIDYAAKDGGFVLVFEDSDVQVWHDTDEDIELVGRSEGSKGDAHK